jgi:hypothetical protein
MLMIYGGYTCHMTVGKTFMRVGKDCKGEGRSARGLERLK